MPEGNSAGPGLIEAVHSGVPVAPDSAVVRTSRSLVRLHCTATSGTPSPSKLPVTTSFHASPSSGVSQRTAPPRSRRAIDSVGGTVPLSRRRHITPGWPPRSATMVGANALRSSHSRIGGSALVALRASSASSVRRLSGTTISAAASPESWAATGERSRLSHEPGSKYCPARNDPRVTSAGRVSDDSRPSEVDTTRR